jgi:C1A family cysteine protease
LFEAPSTNLSSFANTETLEASGDYPSALDWTEYGVVNEVKDQITCQVSSVFATVAAIESMTAITSGKFIAMSEQ